MQAELAKARQRCLHWERDPWATEGAAFYNERSKKGAVV